MTLGPTYEITQATSMLNRVNYPSMPFDWSINPYRGCTHGCSFCYARSTHTYLGKEADDSFRTQILVKANAAEALEAQLGKLARRHGYNLTRLAEELGVVQIGTATDPYQPVEARSLITRKCLHVLHKFRVPTSITTRSPLILRDVDLLRQMDIRGVYLSVHTLDKMIWRNLEPSTPSPVKRLETIRELTSAGIRAGVLLAPIIPHISDSQGDLDAVIRTAAAYGADFLFPSTLRLDAQVKAWFLNVVQSRYPREAAALREMYKGEYAPKWYQDKLAQRISPLLELHGFGKDGRREMLHERPKASSDVYLEGMPIQLSLPI